MESFEDTIGEVVKNCQAARRERIIHHRERQCPWIGEAAEDPGYVSH
jgi:hypothetical protein